MLISFVIPAQAKRIAGGLYDGNGNLIQADFAPEDAVKNKKSQNKPKRDFDKEPLEWKFGNKPINVNHASTVMPGAPLPAAYRPAFGTYGVTEKWGEPSPRLMNRDNQVRQFRYQPQGHGGGFDWPDSMKEEAGWE